MLYHNFIKAYKPDVTLKQAQQAHEKVCNENERNKKKKRCMHKNIFDGRKQSISHIRTTGENNLNELHNEGIICSVNE